MISVIIPAFNEEKTIRQCLMSIHHQSISGLEILVILNGCTDTTPSIIESIRPELEQRNYIRVISLDKPGKIGAIRAGDDTAKNEDRIYLDADVTISPFLIEQFMDVFNRSSGPVFVSGKIIPTCESSFISRAYASIWAKSPYIKKSALGLGCYGVNNSGRNLWKSIADVYSDDKYIRLQFSETIRYKVKAEYNWPIPDGFYNLLSSRVRWTSGNRQLMRDFPELFVNDPYRHDIRFLCLLLKMPLQGITFCTIYFMASIIVFFQGTPTYDGTKWFRSR